MTRDNDRPPPRISVPIATAAPEWRSSLPQGGVVREPTLHFVTGLPRSGATVLLSILHQNPRFYAAPVSALGEVYHNMAVSWQDNKFHQAASAPPGPERLLRAVLGRYHDTDRPVVFDKQHMWSAAIPGLERVLQRKVRMIALVRRLPHVLASLEVLRKRGARPHSPADFALGSWVDAQARADFYLGQSGFVGMPLQALGNALRGGFGDRLLFVDYDRLVDDPQEQLARIYTFFGEKPFEHDLAAIEPLGLFDGTPLGFPGMFDLRPALGRSAYDPVEVLGQALYERLDQPMPWASLV